MLRIIRKGNVKGDYGYDIRITEDDGKEYYYHILMLEDGESVIPSSKPFNIRGEDKIQWDELSPKVKEVHLNQAYPNATLSTFEKNCFLYGEQQAMEIKKVAERKEEEERQLENKFWSFSISYFLAKEIYNQIGNYDKVEVISKTEVVIDDRLVVRTDRRGRQISEILEIGEYEKQRHEWGRRVAKIAKEANTSYDAATVVGDIENMDEAVNTLKNILEIIYSQEFTEYFKREWLWLHRNHYNLKREIRNYFCLNPIFNEYYFKLNWNNKFYHFVEKILK